MYTPVMEVVGVAEYTVVAGSTPGESVVAGSHLTRYHTHHPGPESMHNFAKSSHLPAVAGNHLPSLAVAAIVQPKPPHQD